jgi:hypothetical protein
VRDEYTDVSTVYEELQAKVQEAAPSMTQPAAQLLFTYLLSGSDYIPATYYVPFKYVSTDGI